MYINVFLGLKWTNKIPKKIMLPARSYPAVFTCASREVFGVTYASVPLATRPVCGVREQALHFFPHKTRGSTVEHVSVLLPSSAPSAVTHPNGRRPLPPLAPCVGSPAEAVPGAPSSETPPRGSHRGPARLRLRDRRGQRKGAVRHPARCGDADAHRRLLQAARPSLRHPQRSRRGHASRGAGHGPGRQCHRLRPTASSRQIRRSAPQGNSQFEGSSLRAWLLDVGYVGGRCYRGR